MKGATVFLPLVVLDTTKVQIFKQITTIQCSVSVTLWLFQIPQRYRFSSKSQQSPYCLTLTCCCFRYHKGTDFQANHNYCFYTYPDDFVVLDTTKVQIFKQITTLFNLSTILNWLFQIPQRYRFSSKSQLYMIGTHQYRGCFRYHKGTDFQANHNTDKTYLVTQMLFQIPQRYRFSSKSQRERNSRLGFRRCFRYHKGTDFQANHNVCNV